MATMIGLKVARDQRAGWDVRREGVSAGPPLGLYLSTETHVVSDRAADTLGLGAANVRHIAVDDGYRMRVDELRSQIARDREQGIHPIAIVGTAGTVSTGAIDPLADLAQICADEGLWFHVDAAYGGPAMLADDLRPQLAGIERADSVAFDPHKWLYTPHSGGCLLVRDMEVLRESFDAYAAHRAGQDATGHGIDGRYGPSFSTQVLVAALWVSLWPTGAMRTRDGSPRRGAGAIWAHGSRSGTTSNCALRSVVDGVLPVRPPELPADLDADARGAPVGAEQRIVTGIQLDGRVFCSNAILQERFTLRVCIVNFRTEADEMDLVLDVAAELGTQLDREMRPSLVERPA
jgi:hypothetical protein